MVCPTLNAEDYQSLIDLGWRRSGTVNQTHRMKEGLGSGKRQLLNFGVAVCVCVISLCALSIATAGPGDYLYKQDNVVSCCCNYTIRLNVKKYTRNKAQRAAINRFERFLRGEHVGSTAAADEHGDKDQVMGSNGPAAAASLMSDVVVAAPGSAAASVPVDPRAERIRTALLESIEALVRAGGLPASLTPDSYTKQLRVYPYVAPAAAAKKSAAAVGAPAAPVAPAAAPSPQPQWASNAALVLSGLLRKQKQQEAPPVHVAQLLSQQLSAAATSALPPIQSFVAEPSGHLNFYIEGATATAAPATRRGSVSQDRTKKAPFVKKADSAASMPSAATAAPAAASAHLSTSTSAAATSSSNGKVHKFEVRQVPATFDATAFAVYKKYQMAVHGDKESKLTPKQYTNFLCNSPLVLSDKHPYGGFHHHYLLDDQLVAVGVVDVLPSCLSSVYLFYDPSFEFLNLGTVTAVKEIEWVQQKLLPNYPDIKFYYMGQGNA
jgi:arginine-tRNA-protein transferase